VVHDDWNEDCHIPAPKQRPEDTVVGSHPRQGCQQFTRQGRTCFVCAGVKMPAGAGAAMVRMRRMLCTYGVISRTTGSHRRAVRGRGVAAQPASIRCRARKASVRPCASAALGTW